MAGGLIFLYKEKIAAINWMVFLPITIVSVLGYYLHGGNIYACLAVSSVFVIQAISINLKNNKWISFLSGLSMEVYLSHMVMFRLIELFKLNMLFGDGWVQYSITVILVFTSSIIFSFVIKKFLDYFINRYVRKV